MAIIGAHVSAAGGMQNCFVNAKKIGAECIQIFGSAPQQWHTTLPSAETVASFKSEQTKTKIKTVFLHAGYLANLANIDDVLFEKSIHSLSEHLQIAEMVGAVGLIFHTGSAKGQSKTAAMKRTAEGIKKVLKNVSGKALLIMENSSGGGDKIGVDEVELGNIFNLVNSSRLKLCFDTAHAFESGLWADFKTTTLNKFVTNCDQLFGWSNVVVLHVNDSKTKYGSHADRHENIGDGEIGLTNFQFLANNKHFNALPWILEVPGISDNGSDQENISRLVHLFAK